MGKNNLAWPRSYHALATLPPPRSAQNFTSSISHVLCLHAFLLKAAESPSGRRDHWTHGRKSVLLLRQEIRLLSTLTITSWRNNDKNCVSMGETTFHPWLEINYILIHRHRGILFGSGYPRHWIYPAMEIFPTDRFFLKKMKISKGT